ncbi:MAG: hypothetical protein V2J07_09900 [Anaerolineae bacterium]|jgi:hypothetical protein|nr:hypothetical protein [Anaerolineae bacterium]
MNKPENLVRNWWWIVLCGIIFASISNLVLMILPKQYTQKVDLQILFQTTPDINWTDKTMLEITEKMGALVESSDIQSLVVEELHREGYALNADDFSRFTQKERRFYGWNLSVATGDPALTETFLHIWQITVMNAILSDFQVSEQTQEQLALAEAWIPCFQQLPAEPIHPVCNPSNAAMIADRFDTIYNEFEAAKSRVKYLTGFPPAYSVLPLHISPIEKTFIASRNLTILLGTIAGVLTGTLTIESPWTRHLSNLRGAS